MRKALVLASTASMIDQFNMNNIELLQELGYEVDVACNFKDGNTTSEERINIFKQELKRKNITVYHIPIPRRITRIRDMSNAYKRIKNIIDQNNYKILHCQSPIGGAIARIASRYARKTGLKVIYTAHGFHFYKGAPVKNWLLYYPVEKYLSKYTDCLITINREDYALAIHNNFRADHIKYINGVGIDSQCFQAMIDKDKRRLRAAYAYRDGDFILFYAAELNENKNQIFLINMINELKMEIPDIKLLLAGIGPLEKEYKNAVKELNLEKYVDFLGYRDDIDKLLQICDVVVPSSLREGLPINLLEAMACGKPIVASDNRGHRELVKDGVNGYLYQPSDKSKAVNSIIKLYKSPELCKKMGQAGADMAKQYDVEIVMKEMGKIYAKYI